MRESPPRDFTYQSVPSRVRFGRGCLDDLPAELDRAGLMRALFLSTPRRRELPDRGADLAGSRTAGVFDRAKMHVPVEVVAAAIDYTAQVNADCLVAIGGGSTIGLAKGVALQTGLPIICAPTTYSGSEMTPIWGLTQDGVKRTGRDLRVLPATVLYDPDLSDDLPYPVSVVSGFNALAHACEGLYAQDRNPVMGLMAEEGIRALMAGLIDLGQKDDTAAARDDCLFGAWLCGTVLGNVGMALHHKLCHTLGGSFDLPHAEVHTVVLPHALAYNASAAPTAMATIARALGVPENPAKALHEAALKLGAPVALRDLGMPYEGLGRATELAMSNAYWNPRPLEETAVRALLERAWSGQPPLS